MEVDQRPAQVSQRILDEAALVFVASMGYDNAKNLRVNLSYTTVYSDAHRALQRALARDYAEGVALGRDTA